MVFGAFAAVLFLLGLLVPQKLEGVEKAWMSLAHVISRVTTPIFMGIVYFVVLSPIGAIRRMAGANPIDRAAVASDSIVKIVSFSRSL